MRFLIVFKIIFVQFSKIRNSTLLDLILYVGKPSSNEYGSNWEVVKGSATVFSNLVKRERT